MLLIDVANSKRPLLIITKVQLHLHAPAHYCSFLPAAISRFFADENLVTANTQLRLYSEQQRAFRISNICYYYIISSIYRTFTYLYYVPGSVLKSWHN